MIDFAIYYISYSFYYLLLIWSLMLIEKFFSLVLEIQSFIFESSSKIVLACLRNSWHDLSLNRDMWMIYSWYNFSIFPDQHTTFSSRHGIWCEQVCFEWNFLTIERDFVLPKLKVVQAIQIIRLSKWNQMKKNA